jgi:hypothetical protein
MKGTLIHFKKKEGMEGFDIDEGPIHDVKE